MIATNCVIVTCIVHVIFHRVSCALALHVEATCKKYMYTGAKYRIVSGSVNHTKTQLQ